MDVSEDRYGNEIIQYKNHVSPGRLMVFLDQHKMWRRIDHHSFKYRVVTWGHHHTLASYAIYAQASAYSLDYAALVQILFQQGIIMSNSSEQLGTHWNVFGLWNMRITESL